MWPALHLQPTAKFTAAEPSKEAPRGTACRPPWRWSRLTDRDLEDPDRAGAAVLVLVAYWFLLLAPKREEASTAKTIWSPAGGGLERRGRRPGPPRPIGGFEASYARSSTRQGHPATADMPSLPSSRPAAEGTGIRSQGSRLGTVRAPAQPAHTSRPARAPGVRYHTAPAAPGGDAVWVTLAPGPLVRQRRASDRKQTGTAADHRGGKEGPPDTHYGRRRGHGPPHDRHATAWRASRPSPPRARVRGQLLQPGRLLPRRETLRLRPNSNVVGERAPGHVESLRWDQRRGRSSRASRPR